MSMDTSSPMASSPPLSPSTSERASHESSVLTPSKKVQALLAQFSDSDSENNVSDESNRKKGDGAVEFVASENNTSESEAEDDIQSRSRMAARLLGDSNKTLHLNSATKKSSIEPSTSNNLPQTERSSNNVESSDDEIANPAQTRRKRFFNKTSGQDRTDDSPNSVRSQSPLFFPSPNGSRPSASPQSSQRPLVALEHMGQTQESGRSKFLALVDKHRKERLAKEAAEVAKRAAGLTEVEDATPRRVRGSSPADDSGEGSSDTDDDAVKRIQKQARPTRKASKKALEEMNRETQRMNRNMQLAHQATTRKKITKQSLLARFNFLSEDHRAEELSLPTKTSTRSSSNASSDHESDKEQSITPPTSPPQAHEETAKQKVESKVRDLTGMHVNGQAVTEMHGALSLEDEYINRQILDRRMQQLLDYELHDLTVISPPANRVNLPQSKPQVENSKLDFKASVRPSISASIRASFVSRATSDSDDEIEIVKDRGLKRKYAAFETLPKRKAKEMPSHLALRSLAHLASNDDKKRSMNAAELEFALRKKARVQAHEERRQKIEELKARGIVIQTSEERERDQQEVEDLVERARQEAAEIHKREKELAKKDGTYVKDNLDDEENESEDSDFEEEIEASQHSESEDGTDEMDEDDEASQKDQQKLIDDEVDEAGSDEETEGSDEEKLPSESEADHDTTDVAIISSRSMRKARVISDDEDEEAPSFEKHIRSPQLPPLSKTPLSAPRSVRKLIPGLQMSDDLPMGLSQAFAATMAESQSQVFNETQEEDSLDLTADLPSPDFAPVPLLQRMDSIDLVSDSQPSASQTQPLNLNLLSQSQMIPESPRRPETRGTQFTPSQQQMPFELTQDNGYILSPFLGNRFAETPKLDDPRSTIETVIIPQGIEDSPIVQRRGRLLRGRGQDEEVSDNESAQPITAFQVMRQAAKNKVLQDEFNKKKSEARKIVDEAAEESEDEYAGLGGASDDSGDDEETEADRRMIDEDTQVGQGDEAKLAGLFADRERERDEKEVSKLLKDITTGALRRKRGVGDDLDLSDEEDAAARRREAKRREFARMRKELLKDEAVGKIAEDKKKEAFLRSIEDHEAADDDDEDFDQNEPVQESESQSQEVLIAQSQEHIQTGQQRKQPFEVASESQMNRLAPALRRSNPNFNRKPATLAEIRESVSFLIEEPDSQAAMVDLGLSDSEDEPEAYVNLDRHFREAEADENALDDDNEDLGDFIINDEPPIKSSTQQDLFKKPELPRQERASFTERRTKHTEVVDRLSLLRQASSSASSTASNASATNKMAFISSKSGAGFAGVPTLLRRTTTNSSLGSMSGRENVSATGVVTNKTERGQAGEEKEFVRKGNGGRRNAVNYQAERRTLREEKMSARAGIMKASKGKKKSGFLGGLFRGDSWD